MLLTFDTMKTRVGRRIQKTDATFLTKIEDWLNERYAYCLDRFINAKGPIIKTKSVTATADAETLVLGKDVDAILDVHDRVNDVHLTVSDPSAGGRETADIQDTSGIPKRYWREEDTVNAQPTAASVIAIVSSAAGDTTQKVRLWGVSNGEEVTELVSLNGTTSVNSANSYTRLDRVSKDGNTTGRITGTSNAAAVTNFIMAPTEVSPRYVKIHLVRRPDSAIVYTLTYVVKPQLLANAEDVPLVDCSTAMVVGAFADALVEQKQFESAATQEARFAELVELLIAKVEQREEFVPRFIPHVEADALDEPF